jgi:hypothetical protein
MPEVKLPDPPVDMTDRCPKCFNYGIQSLRGIGSWWYRHEGNEIVLRGVVPRKVCVTCGEDFNDAATLVAQGHARQQALDAYLKEGRD